MKVKLVEATVDQEVEKEAKKALENPDVVKDARQIESALDNALEIAKVEQEVGGKDWVNLLFEGPAGTGKTGRIVSWAKQNNINLVSIAASTMDQTDLGGAVANSGNGTAIRLASEEFDELGTEQDSVLFLDEWNRADPAIRGTLLTLIQDHVIPDPRVKGRRRFLPNFLFTVAAINPADANYETNQLDDAELGRVARIKVQHDAANTKKYLVDEFTRKLNVLKQKNIRPEYQKRIEGQIGLINAVLGAKEFHFDTPQEVDKSKDVGNGLVTNARNFTNTIAECNGTKDDFIDKWNRHCNSTKLPLIKQILANYKDVDDKANDALKGGTDSQVFGARKESTFSKLFNAAQNISK